ncbi:MAG: glycosyltransferase [Candidatus Lindowbacteria bacterium]|nr:glycosyltransferase [Candidatus Lindowbacteria bacterium]
MTADKISLVFPCYNEEETIELLYKEIVVTINEMPEKFEIIFVDDHSADRTREILKSMSEKDPRVKYFRLNKNSGSHTAIFAGLSNCTGDAAIVMAADLQDPPRFIPELIEQWRSGSKVVWGVRNSSPGIPSEIYYTAIKWFTAIKVPPMGTCLFLADRMAINALTSSPEKHTSVFMLLAWLGFDSSSITYHKDDRVAGTSKWTLDAKIKMFVDTMLAFSDMPIRYMSILGIGTAIGGILCSFAMVANFLMRGQTMPGWMMVLAAVLFVGGIQMTMLGLLGEYLWRTYDESRRRPRYVIESNSDS